MSLLNKPLAFPSGNRSYGVLECFLATLIFFSPNFLFIFEGMRDKLFILFLYNFAILYLLISILTHRRFKAEFL